MIIVLTLLLSFFNIFGNLAMLVSVSWDKGLDWL